jgi:hypothetical protein
MKSFLAIISLVWLVIPSTVEAQGQNGRYCFTMRNGATNCGFQTRAQCERARLGVTNDICRPNPRYRRR